MKRARHVRIREHGLSFGLLTHDLCSDDSFVWIYGSVHHLTGQFAMREDQK